MNRVWNLIKGGPLLFFALVLLTAALVGMLAVEPGAVFAQGDGEEDHSGQSCAECHLDYTAAWETGVHAIAYTRASFQEALAAEENPEACLDCHTTNYMPNTGAYTENVVCEACHGLNPADHPPADFVVGTDEQTCGQCHTHTFEEWRRSPHAFTEDMGTVACATCHNPHGQTLRFESSDQLCLNCHEAAPNTYVHLTHNEVSFENVDVELTCASCHMHRAQGLGDGTMDDIEGHQIPDHTMTVETVPCTDCHEALSLTGEFPILVDVDTVLAEERDALRHEVTELQEALSEAEAEAEENQGISFIQLTQGLIIGLGIGITLTWVLVRRESNNRKSNRSTN